MLLGFEHVNLVASDMNRTLAFYVGLLGLTLRVRRRTDRAIACGDWMRQTPPMSGRRR